MPESSQLAPFNMQEQQQLRLLRPLRPLQMSQLVTLFHPIGRDYTFHKSARVCLGPADTDFIIRWLT